MLEVKNMVKTFFKGTINEKTALQGIDLRLEEGDFCTVIGGNGAGKSTLLNSIAGVFPVDEGSITINNIDVTKMPEYKRAKYIGRVFQDPMVGTAGNMQIEENLILAMRRGKNLGLKWAFKDSEQAFFKERLALLGLGLEDRLSARMGLLSGGQRQSITLLMATMLRPDLLLLDEHTAALDPKTAENVLQLTDKLVSEHNLTTLMITHNMRDALRFGNRLIMMDAGRIIYDVKGEEKKKLTVADLLQKFEVAGEGALSDRMMLHIRHDRHRLQQYHNLLLTFSFCLLLFYNCSSYSFKHRRRRFFDFYLPMQNLPNISFTRSSPTDSPRILPRFSYAFIRSIEKKSSGIPTSILFLTRSRLLSASSNAAL